MPNWMQLLESNHCLPTGCDGMTIATRAYGQAPSYYSQPRMILSPLRKHSYWDSYSYARDVVSWMDVESFLTRAEDQMRYHSIGVAVRAYKESLRKVSQCQSSHLSRGWASLMRWTLCCIWIDSVEAVSCGSSVQSERC
ncbi:hypothetical protein PMAYCL1PPCAC_11259 [Pristionchus mayeri]|uniref:Uncharacterized protein n=1 Tax=Pristionchus mayeri TaxID=1317129 RepID=A0AAN5CG76_9BILA|nr:hypothetical protein PMAYCL1PPCAC_11255 [Pristionchus mayeri]GMR41061.1 hypothetical protein PMAYCL1PPCAC_11256 [Pristionchus mayeri]GMR41064.1 hypothetical protein PMAYCL1PPCAC_11259 [Pristionchus mayeri]